MLNWMFGVIVRASLLLVLSVVSLFSLLGCESFAPQSANKTMQTTRTEPSTVQTVINEETETVSEGILGSIKEETASLNRVTQVLAKPNKPYPKQDMLFVQQSLWPDVPQAYPEPNTSQLTPFNLWSTFYRVHVTSPDAQGVPLKTLRGEVLTTLAVKDWCYAALEGTAYVTSARSDTTANGAVYNYAGRGKNRQTDCSPWFSKFKNSLVKAMEQTRFSRVQAPFGTGGKGWWLVPFRSIAVDRKRVALGSVVYIPSVRGQTVVLPDGRIWQHDGYFLAADTGGAIKTNHIDLFTGFYPDNPFVDLEASNAKRLVEAYVVENPQIQQALIQQHQPRS